MQGSAEALMATLSFLQPSMQDITDVPGAEHASDLEDREQVLHTSQGTLAWLADPGLCPVCACAQPAVRSADACQRAPG